MGKKRKDPIPMPGPVPGISQVHNKFGPMTSLLLCRLYSVLNAGRDGTLDCILHQSPKFYHNVFLFDGLKTQGTFIEF